MLSAIAAGMGRTARVALRVNPDVDAGTHAKITTGRAGDKFGIPYAEAAALYAHAATLPGIRPIGLAMHIGSQILSMRAVPRRLRPHRRAGPRAAGRRPARSRRWIAAAAWASPTATSPPPAPPRWPARSPGRCTT